MKYPLYIKTNKRRGGVIDGVHLHSFTGSGVERDALFVNMNYNSETGIHPVAVRNITVDRMTVDGARSAWNLAGLETDHISDVHVRNSTSTRIANPNTVQHVDDLRVTNVTINGSAATPHP